MSMQGLGVLPSAAADTVKTSVEPSQQSKREDWRKAKELEEARKAGTAPALRDEEGRDINPHIPQYISTVPWYVGYNQPTLKHQRPQSEKQKQFSEITSWYKKGVREGSTSTKFRKGACENCGAMTHKKKDCVERPRKVGAKFTGDHFAPDEHLQPNLDFDYDGKRDRWNGYNPKEYEAVLDEYAKIEEAKKQLKAKELQDLASGELTTEKLEGAGDSDNSDADDDKYADDFDMPGTNFDSKRRITVRNLRIREDTAKYLYSLDPNSAYYDPKTRSMRQNPFKDKPGEESTIAGDNFVRATGDTKEMATAQLFAWEASEKGTDVHLQADPTKLELLHKEFTVKKDDFKTNQKGSILERYGGAEHLDAPPKELLLAQTEDYVEYSRHGNIIKGQERAKAKSKYQEDVFSNNHTSVWGSYWRDFFWGYGCCHSTVRGSYCTGQAGKQASIADNVQPMEEAEGENQEEPKSLVEQHRDKLEKERRKKEKRSRKKKKNKRKKKRQQSSSDDSESDSGEDEEEIKRKKLQEALRKEAESQREAERILAIDERKRPYNSLRAMETKEPTEEEMEAFMMKRKRFEDPMSHF